MSVEIQELVLRLVDDERVEADRRSPTLRARPRSGRGRPSLRDNRKRVFADWTRRFGGRTLPSGICRKAWAEGSALRRRTSPPTTRCSLASRGRSRRPGAGRRASATCSPTRAAITTRCRWERRFRSRTRSAGSNSAARCRRKERSPRAGRFRVSGLGRFSTLLSGSPGSANRWHRSSSRPARRWSVPQRARSLNGGHGSGRESVPFTLPEGRLAQLTRDEITTEDLLAECPARRTRLPRYGNRRGNPEQSVTLVEGATSDV